MIGLIGPQSHIELLDGEKLSVDNSKLQILYRRDKGPWPWGEVLFTDPHREEDESYYSWQLTAKPVMNLPEMREHAEEMGVNLFGSKRTDPKDGNAYTREEFIEKYGDEDGPEEWAAAPVGGGDRFYGSFVGKDIHKDPVLKTYSIPDQMMTWMQKDYFRLLRRCGGWRWDDDALAAFVELIAKYEKPASAEDSRIALTAELEALKRRAAA